MEGVAYEMKQMHRIKSQGRRWVWPGVWSLRSTHVTKNTFNPYCTQGARARVCVCVCVCVCVRACVRVRVHAHACVHVKRWQKSANTFSNFYGFHIYFALHIFALHIFALHIFAENLVWLASSVAEIQHGYFCAVLKYG